MSLQMPNLDDRGFDDLLAEALEYIQKDLHTSWNDFSPGDPGVILLEAFSFLTEQMIYRLNRLPEKAYIAFLRMLGVGLKPPYAARVELSFWQEPAGKSTVQVPRGTQVTSEPQGGEAIVFTTIEDLDVPPESFSLETARTVMAYNATWVEEDLPVKSSGLPGQVLSVKRQPILGSMRGLEMRLGVELAPNEWQVNDWIVRNKDVNDDTVRHFQVWQEVENFAGLAPDARVYRVDRQEGLIQFAPAAYLYQDEAVRKSLAAVPPKDVSIHVRYPFGGGASGNIPAGVLKHIRDSANFDTKVKVTNLEPARGGMDAEALENALVRGPQEVFTQERLITARDFERRVLRAWPDIARTRACALQEIWEHAVPGTVSISLVPALRGSEFPIADTCTKEALEREQARLGSSKGETAKELEAESPLGIRAQLDWARYKRVWVSAEATVPRGVETEPIRKRLQDMLYRTICPLPQPVVQSQGKPADGRKGALVQNGWDYGAELRLAEVSRWILSSEDNIRLLRKLELRIDSAPDRDIASLAVDYFQSNTWYAASGGRLFRTTNNAAGWEELLDFSSEKSNPSLHLQDGMESPPGGQRLKKVCPSPYRAGLVALTGLAEPTDSLRGYVYLSTDCGESWLRLADIDAEIDDMDWLQRAGKHILLLATSTGLKELHIDFDVKGAPHLEVSYLIPVIGAEEVTLPVYAVKVLTGRGGTARVVVAMARRGGVYLSTGIDLNQAGGTAFTQLATDSTDLVPPDIRCLGVQWCEQENLYLLWAGGMALGPADPGDGCCRWVFDQQLNLQEKTGCWFKEGWVGGSCLGLAFLGYRILAATARGSILVADVKPATKDAPQEVTAWQTFSDPENILPLRKVRFEGLSRTLEEQSRVEHISFTAIASNDRLKNPHPTLVLTGCSEGVFRSQDQGVTFEKVSRDNFRQMKDSVTIPPDWLLVSGQHDIRVVEEDEAGEAGNTASYTPQKEDDHEAG